MDGVLFLTHPIGDPRPADRAPERDDLIVETYRFLHGPFPITDTAIGRPVALLPYFVDRHAGDVQDPLLSPIVLVVADGASGLSAPFPVLEPPDDVLASMTLLAHTYGNCMPR